jgi:hypothetical protein
MAQAPWEDDADGQDEARRQLEARLRHIVVEMDTRYRRALEALRADLFQILARVEEAFADHAARIARLEARLAREHGKP